MIIRDSAWMMFPIVLRRGDKEALMAHLNAYGIETRGLRDTLFLRDLLLRANKNHPPISVETPVDSLRVRFQ